MKQYLIDFFKYNDWANHRILEAMKQVPEKDETVKLFSHLISAQNKWMNRVTNEQADSANEWFGTSLPMDQLKIKWDESVTRWIELLESKNEADLETAVVFARPSDGTTLSVKLFDMVLQINYHSINHRGQMLRLLREQGVKVPPTDYIITRFTEV
ncbi:MAG TPA: DinB family protein [Bacteroidota bacterium]|nr:DinB family protein [Bacteroidota bacterium]